MSETPPRFTSRKIVEARSEKNAVSPKRPYAFHVEPECAASGRVEDVATLFLTNRECPLKCLMCDLWKNTTDASVDVGDIPAQIDDALAQLPPAKHIKLYNSGNFFDPRAIPRDDHAAIASRVDRFENVIVENHPRFCGQDCTRFRELLSGELEIAIGLETVHADVLGSLNKQMTLDDFEKAVAFLLPNDIAVRAFILLRPPFMDEAEGVEWALRSVEFAFSRGVRCCSIIPTRSGNGIMERLERSGQFAPPSLESMETVLEQSLKMDRGRVFMDLWDVERFFDCPDCGPARAARLSEMNLSQNVLPAIACHCGAH